VRIDFLPAAFEELDTSVTWYAARSGLAVSGFAHAIDAALDSIAADPERFPRVTTQHRACTVQGFPFQVIYRDHPDRILVVAIAHAKRRPGYWKTRK